MNLIQKLPAGPFRYDAIGDLGISRHELRRLVRDGDVRVVVRGVYAAATLEDTVEVRAAAVALVSAPGHVVRDRTAAWLHGVDMLLYSEHDAPPPVETCALRGNQPSQRDGVDGRTRDLVPRDIMLLHGLRVTTPLRTALDLGCVLHRRDAMAALDAICRRHGITKEQLVIEVARYRRRRGVVQLRELVGLVEPRAESARESWMRLAIHDAGLPAPEPQYWVVVDGEPRYRIDLAYPKHRVAIEYDGWEAHEQTPDQRERDRVRRQWLREHGWTVIVVRRGDFTRDALDRWTEEVRAALRPSYTNVRDLERGSRQRRIEQATG
ncbi:endonuclease domain-containing protein [Nocardioides silvaticus]|uniref:endonuclease domain-containing protein n=1 Tax=Nocardioides silvaticus TaxID=2201891 RepID=UPI001FE50A45|nr:type IV toxin-antitoxin system AbiEi family antitoxin domain-containing protein [Nocardioides silvaticus]